MTNKSPTVRAATKVLDCGHETYVTVPSCYDREGRTYCKDCAIAREEAVFFDWNTTKYSAYVSSDGKRIITGYNSSLARVTRMYKRKMPRDTYSIWAIDKLGRRWFGIGLGEGMWIKLRVIKDA